MEYIEQVVNENGVKTRLCEPPSWAAFTRGKRLTERQEDRASKTLPSKHTLIEDGWCWMIQLDTVNFVAQPRIDSNQLGPNNDAPSVYPFTHLLSCQFSIAANMS